MIKLENYEVVGWEHAVRGMRNPMNSWAKSDSNFKAIADIDILEDGKVKNQPVYIDALAIGDADHSLMMKLRNAGTDHRKFMRMITVYVDITAPLYWWKEFDTYKVGTVANSCSTMHKIHEKEFVTEDFSTDRLTGSGLSALTSLIYELNNSRDLYLATKDKQYWDNMIQLLPTSYNQKRTVMLNYEVLANIYKSRKNHKLDEWKALCEWIKELPYSELITGGEEVTGISDKNKQFIQDCLDGKVYFEPHETGGEVRK